MAVVSLEYFFDIVSIPAWIHFERLARLQQCNVTLDIKFRPVHAALLLTSAGNPIPYSTPALKKAYFEEQRLLSRIYGASIKTSPEIIDNILSGLSNFILPQCALNMVASMYSHRDFLALSRTFWRRIWIENKSMQTEDDLLEALNDSGIPSTSMGIISDNKWSAQLNECHDQALDSKCFGIPWTLLRFEDGTSKVFFGSDRWPLICSHLKIPYKLFGDIKL